MTLTVFGWLALGIPTILVVWGLIIFGGIALAIWARQELRRW